jgi:hypothetical protein
MTVVEVVMGHRRGGEEAVPREERNSNSGLGFMLGNLAMGFERRRRRSAASGVDDVVIGGAFKLSGPSTVAPVVALQPYPLANIP